MKITCTNTYPTPHTTISAADTPSELIKCADYNCTGSSDETVINEAITATEKGVLYFLPGTYRPDGSINVTSNLIFKGSGYGTIIEPADNTNAPLFTSSASAALSNVVFEDFYVLGNMANQSSGHAFHLYNPDEIFFNRIKIYEQKGDGIRLERESDDYNMYGRVYVDNSYIGYGGGNGIISNPANDYTIYVVNVNNCNITANNTGYGIYFAGSGKLGVGANTWISNNNVGIHCQLTSRPLIENSHIEYNHTKGIVLYNSDHAIINGCMIRDNPYTYESNPNIHITAGSNHIITNNRIYDDRGGSAKVQYNILGASTPTSCIISNNIITGATSADVSGMDDATNVYEHNIITAA